MKSTTADFVLLYLKNICIILTTLKALLKKNNQSQVCDKIGLFLCVLETLAIIINSLHQCDHSEHKIYFLLYLLYITLNVSL